MALVIDITERKEKEQQIKELNIQLEKKIEKRTEELKQTVTVNGTLSSLYSEEPTQHVDNGVLAVSDTIRGSKCVSAAV